MYDAARAPGSARDPARRTTPGRRSRREEGPRDRRGSPRRGEKLHLPRGEPTRRSALPRPATRRCRRQTPARVEARSRASAKGAPSAARSSAQTGDTRAFKREGGAPPHHCGWPRTRLTAPRRFRRFQLHHNTTKIAKFHLNSAKNFSLYVGATPVRSPPSFRLRLSRTCAPLPRGKSVADETTSGFLGSQTVWQWHQTGWPDLPVCASRCSLGHRD